MIDQNSSDEEQEQNQEHTRDEVNAGSGYQHEGATLKENEVQHDTNQSQVKRDGSVGSGWSVNSILDQFDKVALNSIQQSIASKPEDNSKGQAEQEQTCPRASQWK